MLVELEKESVARELAERNFRSVEPRNFFVSIPWFDCLARHTLKDRERVFAVFPATSASPAPSSVLLLRAPAAQPGSILARQGWRPMKNTLASLHNHQSCDYGAVLAQRTKEEGAACKALGAALAASAERPALVDLNLMESSSAAYQGLAEGLAEQGMWVTRYEYKGSWFEDISSRSFQEFIADRNKSARKALQNYARKFRKLEREEGLTFELISSEHDVERGIEAFAQVEARSWQSEEPYPGFVAAVIRLAASMGALRLGVVRVGATPVAVELAVLAGGRATLFKTHFDPDFSKVSVGAIAIFKTMEYLLDQDRCATVDFGTDDDPYKSTWVSQRRVLSGLLAVDPRSIRGLTSHTRFHANDKIQRMGSRAKRLILESRGAR